MGPVQVCNKVLLSVLLLGLLAPLCYGGTFNSNTDYPTGINGAWSIAVGDFNNDGHPDLVSGDLVNSTISVLLNNGDGTFQPHQEFPAGTGPYSVAVGDFNRDGNLDIAVADQGDTTGNLAILIGNGDGTFQPYVSYPTGLATQSVAVADFNQDGKLDVAVANLSNANVGVLLGNGDGTFQAQVTYGGLTYSDNVTAADLNADGYPDLIVPNGTNQTVAVLLNQGNGTFGKPAYFPSVMGMYAGSYAVAVADLNHDGKPDLAVANDDGVNSRSFNSISVLLGNGDGTFQPYQEYHTSMYAHSIAVADFDRDGNPDVVLGDFPYAGVSVIGVGTLLGTPVASFGPESQHPTGFFPVPVLAADLNGDGLPDIAVGDYNCCAGTPGHISVLLNTGGTVVTAVSSMNPSQFGQPVTFTVTVTATVGTGRTPTGTVFFRDGTQPLGSASLVNGQASFTTASLAVGQHTINARYSGSPSFKSNDAQPITQQVNP